MANLFLHSSVMRDYLHPYCKMENTREENGLLGGTTVWKEGERFDAAEQHDTSTQAQIAEQSGTASTYTLYFDASVVLHCGDRIRRMDDGQTFEVTTNSTDARTPAESGMDLCAVQCRKGVLADECSGNDHQTAE